MKVSKEIISNALSLPNINSMLNNLVDHNAEHYLSKNCIDIPLETNNSIIDLNQLLPSETSIGYFQTD